MSCCRCCSSTLRAFENVPLFGHLIAMCYGCTNQKDKAERAAIKASVGIAFALCNCPAEAADEALRKRTERLSSRKLTARSSWMKIHKDKVIQSLCLPGSHQSGTYHMQKKLKAIPMSEGWSRCQSHDIYEQLIGGIRFLDLRIMDHEGDIWLHHNVVICVSLKDALTMVKTFINEFPTEIVGIYITNDGKAVDWSKCNDYINMFFKERLMFEHMKDMLLGDLVDQGKNIMIFGVPNVAYSWKGLEYRWPNKSKPSELRADFIDTLTSHDRNPREMFWYKAECTPDGAVVARSIGGVPGVAMVRRAEEKYDFLEDLAGAANYAIYDVVQDLEYLPFNIISFDYVPDDLLAYIIALNERQAEAALGGLDMTQCTSDIDSVFTENTLTATVMSEEYPLRASTRIEVRETNM